eukprot:8929710-Lingulodinium_polyedra.AAC.1
MGKQHLQWSKERLRRKPSPRHGRDQAISGFAAQAKERKHAVSGKSHKQCRKHGVPSTGGRN